MIITSGIREAMRFGQRLEKGFKSTKVAMIRMKLVERTSPRYLLSLPVQITKRAPSFVDMHKRLILLYYILSRECTM